MHETQYGLADGKYHAVLAGGEHRFRSVVHCAWLSSTTGTGTSIAVVRIRITYMKSRHFVSISYKVSNIW